MRLPPGKDRELWTRQLVALQVLEWLGVPDIESLVSALANHPSDEIRRRVTSGTAAAKQEVLVTQVGGVPLVRIPAGTFEMGSPDGEEGRYEWEGPQHSVTVPGFLIGRYAVTNEEYARFLMASPNAKERGVGQSSIQPGPPAGGGRELGRCEQLRRVGGLPVTL